MGTQRPSGKQHKKGFESPSMIIGFYEETVVQLPALPFGKFSK